jgi:hypothetical protein
MFLKIFFWKNKPYQTPANPLNSQSFGYAQNPQPAMADFTPLFSLSS